ncbi:aminoglycoside phosphotransferase family protein [Streptomyces sp. NPDC048290]|uniref:phosphotransferase enzyme family protein n=1 Tax=Streptomyces sp. NPDC048290 TaxID=3155811 RepID=UPI003417C9C4
MTPGTSRTIPAALIEACRAAGLPWEDAHPLRIAENQTWLLPGTVVARVTQPGQDRAAAGEVQAARWLTGHQVPVVRPLDIHQPVIADGHPVTFWEHIPGPHTPGSPLDLARTLKHLHGLPRPPFPVRPLDPFVRIPERLDAASTLPAPDRAWLSGLLDDLRTQWTGHRPAGRSETTVHGDSWPGNIIRTTTGVRVLDLERFSLGPPEWDLVSTAVRTFTTGATTTAEYAEFSTAYGQDVTEWDGYPLLAAARELRMTTYAAQHAATDPRWHDQAQYRVDCLRGRHGPRPWTWNGIL